VDPGGAFAARISLPCVLSVGREAPKPRLATAMGVMKAGRKPFTQLALQDLGIEPGSVGKAGALARLVTVSAAERQRKGKAIDASRPDVLRDVMTKLASRGMI
jgi:electron transfer flavoprotein beta subunit